MATVIDSLLVTLGLDPKPYKKGAADANRAQKTLADDTKKSGQQMQAALGSVARQVGLLVLGFESIRGAFSFLGQINSADAALGRLAANTGQNVHEINLWGNAVDLVGGKAEEAQKDFLNLSGSITALRTTGDVSPLIMLMQRLGVAWEDAEGKVRPFGEVLNDIGAKLRSFEDRRAAFNTGAAAGLSEGTLNLLLQEDSARARIFAKAEAQNNLDAAAAERAQKMLEQWRELKQTATEFGRVINQAVFPAVMEFFNALKPIQPVLVDIVGKLKDMGAFTGAATAIRAIADAISLAVDGWKMLIDLMPKAQQAVTDALETIANAGQKVKDAFRNTSEGVANVAAFLFSRDGADTPDASRAPSNMARSAQAQRQAIYAARQNQSLAAGGGVMAAGGGNGGTNVEIGTITVNTQATDAAGLASDLPGELRRKGVVAQADSGLN